MEQSDRRNAERTPRQNDGRLLRGGKQKQGGRARQGAAHCAPSGENQMSRGPVLARGKFLLPNSVNNTTLKVSFEQLFAQKGNQEPHFLRHISGADTEIEISLQKIDAENTNRPFLRYGLDAFVSIKFEVRFDSSKTASGYIERTLLNGVLVDGARYFFMGFSNSKLAEKSCFLFRCNSSAEAAGILERDWGKFEKIHSSAKRSKRISLLFSSVKAVKFERIHPATNKGIRSEVIDDITGNGFNFTDGNAKGILLVSPDLRHVDLQLRRSMIKFEEAKKDEAALFGLVGYSFPYKMGCLNLQTIMLLSSLGIPDDAFLRKQAEHFAFIDKACEDEDCALKMLLTHNEEEWAFTLAEHGITASVYAVLKKLRTKELESCIKAKGKPRPGATRPSQKYARAFLWTSRGSCLAWQTRQGSLTMENASSSQPWTD